MYWISMQGLHQSWIEFAARSGASVNCDFVSQDVVEDALLEMVRRMLEARMRKHGGVRSGEFAS